MIADSADIRFECDKCGQHLVVEAAAAGLTADCPICNTTVTVPTPASTGEPKPRRAARTSEPESEFRDPRPDALREELIDASMLNGKLVGDLGKAREETAALQQQLRELVEEHERLNATATHAQRELKTFQTERQQLKSEAAALRQRIGVADEAAAAQGAELEMARGALETRRQELASATEALDRMQSQLAAEIQVREAVEARLAEAGARLAGTTTDLDGALGRLAATETSLSAVRETVARLEHEGGELRSRLDDAGQRLTAAAELAGKLEGVEAELRAEREKTQAADEANRALKERCEQSSHECEVLRNDLQETHSGREMLEIRSQLNAANTERDRLTQRVEALESDLSKAKASAETLTAERDTALQARDAAREDAAALRDSQTQKDNEVLRGIVARVNAELAQRTGEAARLKRAQYGLRIVYGVFGIGLLAVFAFALKVLPRFMH